MGCGRDNFKENGQGENVRKETRIQGSTKTTSKEKPVLRGRESSKKKRPKRPKNIARRKSCAEKETVLDPLSIGTKKKACEGGARPKTDASHSRKTKKQHNLELWGCGDQKNT